MAKDPVPVDLLIQPHMLGPHGWADLYRQFALQYPGGRVTLHLRGFNGSLEETLAEALRKSGEAGLTITRVPHRRLPEDDYAIRLTWKRRNGG